MPRPGSAPDIYGRPIRSGGLGFYAQFFPPTEAQIKKAVTDYRDIYSDFIRAYDEIVRGDHLPRLGEMYGVEVFASAGPDLVFRSAFKIPKEFAEGLHRKWRDAALLIAGERPILRVVVGRRDQVVVLCRDHDRRIVRRTWTQAKSEEAERALENAVLKLFDAPLHLQREPPAKQPWPSVLD